MSIKPFLATLETSYMITPTVKHFVFRAEDSCTFDYLPGQFITIQFEVDEKTLRRSYSIASPPEKNNRIEFAAGFVNAGPGSEYLFHLAPEQTVHMTGPFGRLVLKDPVPKRYVFVATSTGITPYRAMIPALKKRLTENPGLQIVILQGVQKQADVLYRDEFIALAQAFPQVDFRMQLSRESASNLDVREYSGYVQSAFSSLNLNPEHDLVYLCGNPSMIDESFEALKNLGFEIQHIIREKYISGK